MHGVRKRKDEEGTKMQTTSHIQPPMHEVRKRKDAERTMANNVTYTTTNVPSEEKKR